VLFLIRSELFLASALHLLHFCLNPHEFIVLKFVHMCGQILFFEADTHQAFLFFDLALIACQLVVEFGKFLVVSELLVL
jgi:hypothetical protein